MSVLNKIDLEQRINSSDNSRIWIDPILDENQLGEVTVDLRLGYDFLIPVLTRKPMIGLIQEDAGFRSIASYYQSTRRQVGEKFLLYPNQTVLSTTLEYIALPNDIYADIFTRSSYSRLGINFNAMIQPGFRGCFPLELSNTSNNPIELIVGSRIIQSRFTSVNSSNGYHSQVERRKYFGNIRPTVSQAPADKDLETLNKIASARQRVV